MKDLKLNLKASPAKLFSNLLQAKVQGHILHLQTTSYAQHMALGSFYEGIDSLVDSLIEEYQGKYGIVKSYSLPTGLSSDPCIYIKDLRSLVQTARYTELKQADTNLQNTVDEIISLIDSTLYKLENLK